MNPHTAAEFTVISWNAQGASQWNLDFGKAAGYLNTFRTDFFCLQEMPGAREKLQTVKSLTLFYPVIPNQDDSGGLNNNVVLSRVPIVDSGEIVFPFQNPHSYEKLHGQMPKSLVMSFASITATSKSHMLELQSVYISSKSSSNTQKMRQIESSFAEI